jgi:predicted dehydrogenase
MGVGAPVKWEILSTADINPEGHSRRAHASEKVELMAVASRNLQRAEEYAREWEIGAT